MLIPPQCEPIQAEIDELKGEISSLQAELPGLVGKEKWATVGKIARLNAHLEQRQQALQQCLRLLGPGYATDVVIFDM